MGLDMYLSKRHYVKRWNHMKPAELYDVTVSKGGVRAEFIKPERVSYVIEEVAYWRKANQIHAWFVKNVQNGEDECQESDVSREQLAELLAACKAVIADPEQAEELLPTQSGFFFGGTDYDEDYFDDLKRTATILAELLAEPDEGDFYYRASW